VPGDDLLADARVSRDIRWGLRRKDRARTPGSVFRWHAQGPWLRRADLGLADALAACAKHFCAYGPVWPDANTRLWTSPSAPCWRCTYLLLTRSSTGVATDHACVHRPGRLP